MPHDVAQKVEAFFGKYPLREYAKGQVLIYAGEDSPSIFYIVSGQVRQYDISYRGDEVVLNVYKNPAFFPMLGPIAGVPNRYFFEVFEPSKMRVAPEVEVVEFLKLNPDVTYDLLSRVYRGMDGLLQRMAHLMGGSARSRLLFEIVIECRRFAKHDGGGRYTLSINESELAARAALSRETVNRELKKLRTENLVSVGREGIVVKNLATIEDTLGTEL